MKSAIFALIALALCGCKSELAEIRQRIETDNLRQQLAQAQRQNAELQRSTPHPSTPVATRRERRAHTAPAPVSEPQIPLAPGPGYVWQGGRWVNPHARAEITPQAAPPAPASAPALTVQRPSAPPPRPLPPMPLTRGMPLNPPGAPPFVGRALDAGRLMESYRAIPYGGTCPYGNDCLRMGWIPSGPGFRPPWP